MKRLADLRKSRGITQQQLAKILNIDRTSIGKYEKHDVMPGKDILLKLSDYFGVSVGYLLGEAKNEIIGDILSEKQKKLVSLYDNANFQAQKTAISALEFGQIKKAMQKHDLKLSDDLTDYIYIPVVGRSAAGIPIEMIEHCEDDSLRISDPKIQPGDFAVIAAGDSMVDAGISDGDRVIIRPCPEVENGTIALVAVEDGSTIKRFYKTGKGYRLVPANDAHAPMEYGPDDGIRVLGRFIKVAGDC